ncbi:hypothetical protein, partial [Burkholderia sp. SIMBA_052]|uniref:hypothetical protein n=1 Tax=Burkholderia sp. SIMBA_052 TaxID=3085793 RepID=UPI00397BB1D2
MTATISAPSSNSHGDVSELERLLSARRPKPANDEVRPGEESIAKIAIKSRSLMQLLMRIFSPKVYHQLTKALDELPD